MNKYTKRLGLIGGLVVIAITIIVIYLFWCSPSTTVIVLRHAERDTTAMVEDRLVPLNAAGFARADNLADVAGRAGVTAIYVSQNLRTQQTAAPLATNLGITPTEINTANMDDLIDEVLSSQNRGGVIVIVGHSDTVPTIVDRLGGGTVTVGDQFDNLFILTLNRWSQTRLIKGTYGAPR